MLVRLSKFPLCPREVQGHLFKRLNRYIEEQRRVQAPGSPILSARRRKAASRPVSSCWVLRLSEKFSGQDCKIVPFVCASRHSYRQLSSMKAERATSDHAARGQPSDGFLPSGRHGRSEQERGPSLFCVFSGDARLRVTKVIQESVSD